MEKYNFSDPKAFLGFMLEDAQRTVEFAQAVGKDSVLFLDKNIDLIKLHEEFIQSLIAQKDVQLAVVSSNTNHTIKAVLGDYAKYFDPILGINSGSSKIEKIKRVLDQCGVSADNVLFITDTVGDIKEVGKLLNPEQIIAVTWGYHTKEQLGRAQNLDRIISNYTQIENFLEI